ncbi:HXXEE domain-containing protein [Spirochaeta cellobiosiphila]|uniref:HXXEE domain-containing protein n=1 Tax=Spirochaeta cellobiosiphila TaxID=504483 RepID=UPI000400EE0B|nr:HXXEE domain-containing protein [Spirochaeta cellobiosiphila]
MVLSLLSNKIFYLIIACNLFIHEMEEWNIVQYHQQNYKIPTEETNMSTRLWLLTLSLIGFLFCIVSWAIPFEPLANTVFLILNTFLIINGVQHLLLSLIRKKYNPGLLFGGLIGTSLSIMFNIKILNEHSVPLVVFLVITLGEFIPAIWDSVQSRKKNTLPQMIKGILKIGNYIELKLRT